MALGPIDVRIRADMDSWTFPRRRRRWREVFEGERYPEGFGWKLVNAGIRLALVGDGKMLAITIRWPLSVRFVDLGD